MAEPRPPPPTAWHGAILAGGASRRFGRDKVFAVVDGRRMIDAAAAALGDAVSVTVLLGSAERVRTVANALPPGVSALADAVPGRGPLGGLATALARHPDAWIALLAVDLPRVPARWWRALADHHRAGAVAIVPHDPIHWEPTAALYHGSLAAHVADHVERAEGRALGFSTWLDALAASGRAVAVPTSSLPAGALANVNRPEDAIALENSFTSEMAEPKR